MKLWTNNPCLFTINVSSVFIYNEVDKIVDNYMSKIIYIKYLSTAFNTIIIHFIILILFVSSLYIGLQASTEVFNKDLILADNQIFSLPNNFSSPEIIQDFLVSKGSVLATETVRLQFEKDGSLYRLDTNTSFTPSNRYLSMEGQTMSFANFVWMLSRSNLGSGCSSTFLDLCFDNSVNSINPGFVLAVIQKESGLVYGSCAQVNADTNSGCFYTNLYNQNPTARTHYLLAGRKERATGYYCFETLDKTKGCWDDNPSWKYNKGLFQQVYHMVRRTMILEKTCIRGDHTMFINFRGEHKVGARMLIGSGLASSTGQFVTAGTWVGATGNVRQIGAAGAMIYNEPVGGQPVVFSNGITCALYIYTPHVSDLLWRVMRDIGALVDFRNYYGLPIDYVPKPIGR
jgi:hypothetical protein